MIIFLHLKKTLVIIFFASVCSFIHINQLQAQSINAEFPTSKIEQVNAVKIGSYNATLGTSISNIKGMHGITYKISFDPAVIYKDSLYISANSKELGLEKDEYFEMQRVDSSYVLYSLTVKGRKKTLNLDELPILIDFTIKPETYYQLIANHCEYTIEFQAESVTAYDLKKTEVQLEPFKLPINISCEENGEKIPLVAAPNPTKERCWIYIPADKVEMISKILLFDAKGQQMALDNNLSSDELEINLSSLRPGHYYLNIIYSNGEKDVVKVVKV